MKRLMILGTQEEQRAFIAAARMEQYEVIACADEDMRRYRNEAEQPLRITVSDPRAVLLAASCHGISGIVGVGSGMGRSAAYAARLLELPGMPYAVSRLLHDKMLLREFLRHHHFRVPSYCDISDTCDIHDLRFPVYVGPTDDDRMQHTMITHTMTELMQVRRMLQSRCPGRPIIAQEDLSHERMEADVEEIIVTTNLVVRGGALQPLLWSECIRGMESRDPVLTGCLYPARIDESSRILLSGECSRLITLLHLQDADLGINALVIPGRIPYILSIRPFGRTLQVTELLSVLYQHDLVRDMARIAAGDAPDVSSLAYPASGVCMSVYMIRVHRSGILRQIQFDEELRTYILDWQEMACQSQEIYASPCHGEVIGSMLLQFPDYRTMEAVMGNIEERIEVVMDAFTGACDRYRAVY